MKRIVRGIPWEYVLIGIASLFLVGIIQKENLVSHVVFWGLVATMLWQSWARHRREKARSAPRKQS